MAVTAPDATRRAIVAACAERALSSRELWARSAVTRELGATARCSTCDAEFPSRQAAAVHEYSAHGTLRDVRQLVRVQACAACMQWFETYERTFNHVEKSPRCRLVYGATQIPMSTDEQEAVFAEACSEARRLREKGKRRHFAAQPAIRTEGPLMHEAHAVGICHRTLLRNGGVLQFAPGTAI